MMPEKDGIEMTRELRTDMTTSHIPIILLTAKTTIESKLEGLEYGADDYITKPFSATYLQARVENLLSQRKKLQSFYRENLLNIPVVDSNGSLPGVSTCLLYTSGVGGERTCVGYSDSSFILGDSCGVCDVCTLCFDYYPRGCLYSVHDLSVEA